MGERALGTGPVLVAILGGLLPGCGEQGVGDTIRRVDFLSEGSVVASVRPSDREVITLPDAMPRNVIFEAHFDGTTEADDFCGQIRLYTAESLGFTDEQAGLEVIPIGDALTAFPVQTLASGSPYSISVGFWPQGYTVDPIAYKNFRFFTIRDAQGRGAEFPTCWIDFQTGP